MRDDSTPIATAPPGWSMRPLKELCSIVSGGTPSKSNPEFWRGSIPWVSGKDLKRPLLSDAIDHISEAGLADGSRLAPAGTVFVLVRGMGLAKGLPVAVALRPMAFNQDIKALIPRSTISGEYIRAALFHARERLLSRIVPSAHGTMTLNLDDVQNFEIPVPDQAADATEIARALGSVMLAQDAAKQGAHVIENMKRATMRSLFTRGLKGEAQKETEIGPVPETWSVTPFSSVRDWLQYGTSVRCTYEQSAFPVLRIPNIQPGVVDTADIKFSTLSSHEAAKYRLSEGDLIFIRTNGVVERLGACAVYAGAPKDALFASYLIRARLKTSVISPRFAAHFFASEIGTSIISGRATPAADGKYNLNTGTIDNLPIPLPPSVEEQLEIVTILDAIDRKIDLHRRKRSVLTDLFNALLHKLMTGEVRVSALDLSALNSDVNA